LVDPADCCIYNSGSVRLDDVLTGYITQYDIFRILPFENKIVTKELQGALIDSILRTNVNRKNEGNYLQYWGIQQTDSGFYINGRSLYRDTTYYKVVMNDYIGTGMQESLRFIGQLAPPTNTSPKLLIPDNDIRKALIAKLKKRSANKQWPKINGKIPCY